jgi:hypothetical protein
MRKKFFNRWGKWLSPLAFFVDGIFGGRRRLDHEDQAMVV